MHSIKKNNQLQSYQTNMRNLYISLIITMLTIIVGCLTDDELIEMRKNFLTYH